MPAQSFFQRSLLYVLPFFLLLAVGSGEAAESLKVHGIFRSHMVLQRDKPIMIWGWAPTGTEVTVSLGELSKRGKADEEEGRWQVVFDPQPANAQGQNLVVKAGEATRTLEDILIGDVWVMNGQSNMAFSLKAVYDGAFEASMAHLPLMRHLRINSGAESEYPEKDLKDEFINGQQTNKNWQVVSPEVALEMGAIGFVFGSSVQRSLQIPIGIIDNARGGASLESLVPRHQLAKHPMAADYLAWVDARRSAFSEEVFLQEQMDKWQAAHERWEKDVAADKAKGVDKKRKEPQNRTAAFAPGRYPGAAQAMPRRAITACLGCSKG